MNTEEQQTSEVSIDVCTRLREIRECVNLQRTIWNDPDEDLIPSTLFVVANKIGGQVLLAHDGPKAVGFALAFPAFRDELRYLHSHIVGVAPEYQNRGLGRQLKLKQRELALGMRIPLMEWTFDPLAVRNAYFNIVRLGAVIRRFHSNLYGVTASPLHGGLPTDRLVAEWWLSSVRVDNALVGRAPTVAPDAVQIVVPAEMEDWKISASPHAVEVQSRLKMEFQERFAQGFAVTGFRMEGRNGIYLLELQENQTALSL
jgi:predicted GNAT superfamily acetyltransferase